MRRSVYCRASWSRPLDVMQGSKLPNIAVQSWLLHCILHSGGFALYVPRGSIYGIPYNTLPNAVCNTVLHDNLQYNTATHDLTSASGSAMRHTHPTLDPAMHSTLGCVALL